MSYTSHEPLSPAVKETQDEYYVRSGTGDRVERYFNRR